MPTSGSSATLPVWCRDISMDISFGEQDPYYGSQCSCWATRSSLPKWTQAPVPKGILPSPSLCFCFFFFLPPSCSGSFLVAGPEGLGGSSSFAVCRTHLSTKHQAGGNLEASGAHCLLVQIRTVRHKEGKDLPKATMLCHTDNRVITPICTIFLKSKKNKNK